LKKRKPGLRPAVISPNREERKPGEGHKPRKQEVDTEKRKSSKAL